MQVFDEGRSAFLVATKGLRMSSPVYSVKILSFPGITMAQLCLEGRIGPGVLELYFVVVGESSMTKMKCAGRLWEYCGVTMVDG